MCQQVGTAGPWLVQGPKGTMSCHTFPWPVSWLKIIWSGEIIGDCKLGCWSLRSWMAFITENFLLRNNKDSDLTKKAQSQNTLHRATMMSIYAPLLRQPDKVKRPFKNFNCFKPVTSCSQQNIIATIVTISLCMLCSCQDSRAKEMEWKRNKSTRN